MVPVAEIVIAKVLGTKVYVLKQRQKLSVSKLKIIYHSNSIKNCQSISNRDENNLSQFPID